jgi:hypothetical protein
MAVATELDTLAGQWVAEGSDGGVIAHAKTLAELEHILVNEKRFKDNEFPAIRRIPEDGSTTFIL